MTFLQNKKTWLTYDV